MSQVDTVVYKPPFRSRLGLLLPSTAFHNFPSLSTSFSSVRHINASLSSFKWRERETKGEEAPVLLPR